MASPRTVLCIPTYNEAGNVEPLCRELLAQPVDIDILFMDDASPDGTGAIIDRLAAENPRVKAVHRKGKLGIGSAHLDCIAYAYDHDYDVVMTMDGDFTHPPKYIGAVIEASANYDVVVGSRWITHDSLSEWTLHRRVLTFGAHFLTKNLLRLDHDSSSGLRLYQLRRIPRELFSLVDGTGYSFFFESMYILSVNGFRIGDVAIELPARASGQSKMGVRQALDGAVRLGRMWAMAKANPAKYIRRSQ
jgi:dolichol-phosphate mannosyltransferase